MTFARFKDSPFLDSSALEDPHQFCVIQMFLLLLHMFSVHMLTHFEQNLSTHGVAMSDDGLLICTLAIPAVQFHTTTPRQ